MFCEEHGVVPMKESDLPLLLPDVENYEPTGTEEGPLAEVKERINTPCPICGNQQKGNLIRCQVGQDQADIG